MRRLVYTEADENKSKDTEEFSWEGDEVSVGDRNGIIEDNDPPGHKSGYVAIIGQPNAGKSTLLNALLGQKLSIVTAKAQTTRHRILSIISEPDYQLILLDTPGIMTTQRNKLDERMMANVRQARREADAVLAIADAAAQPRAALQVLLPPEGRTGPPLAIVLNKVDLLRAAEARALEEYMAAQTGVATVLPTSALTGRGVEAVRAWALSQLPEGPTLYPKDDVSEHPERFFVGEIIREKIFELYREEIPYATMVQVVDFKDRGAGEKVLVEVHVIVEATSQRGIIIGKGGSALKALGSAARVDIEEFLGRPVYLDLTVKVKQNWRRDERLVSSYGA
ncbi:hypothetical protein WJX81_008104 [Elliptochloris bilobata]|uniref:GTPase Era n=1 Tax=Elliptochloris bilobata TaxID=381761 RepID=A0AAW1S8C9_9CHLO